MNTIPYEGRCIPYVNQIPVFFTPLFINTYYFQAGK